jgi:hypothetical protein
MSGQEREARIAELQHRLEELEARFQTEAQKRGFEAAQMENVALPMALAKLFAERAEIKSELEELAVKDNGEND